MKQLNIITKELRRSIEGKFNGTFPAEVAKRIESQLLGLLHGVYDAHYGTLGHKGIESQLRNEGFNKRERL